MGFRRSAAFQQLDDPVELAVHLRHRASQLAKAVALPVLGRLDPGAGVAGAGRLRGRTIRSTPGV